MRYGPNQLTCGIFGTGPPCKIHTNLSRNAPGTSRIPRRRQVGGERRKQPCNGGPVNPSRQHGRAMERERETPEEDVRKAPEEGEKRREESLPCLALPLEGVRLGAELDGRHGGRAGSRSSWSTGAGRVAAERSGAEQSTQGTSHGCASTRPQITPEVSHAMGERCNPAFGQHSS